jgi:hypothetical protein
MHVCQSREHNNVCMRNWQVLMIVVHVSTKFAKIHVLMSSTNVCQFSGRFSALTTEQNALGLAMKNALHIIKMLQITAFQNIMTVCQYLGKVNAF